MKKSHIIPDELASDEEKFDSLIKQRAARIMVRDDVNYHKAKKQAKIELHNEADAELEVTDDCPHIEALDTTNILAQIKDKLDKKEK
jgi:hypothetical protein